MAVSLESGSLTRYSVEGLLGRGDFDLPLERGGATLLTGANGTGKSTVLRTLDRFARGAWAALAALTFSKITLEFDGQDPVSIRRIDDGLEIRQRRNRWEYKPKRNAAGHTFVRTQFYGGGDAVQFDIPEDWAGWSTRHERVVVADPEDVTWFTNPSPQPDWLTGLINDFTALFITDRRLVIEDKNQPEQGRAPAESIRAAVSEYANDLRLRILSALSEYGERAQALDKAFPANVLEAMRRSDATEATVAEIFQTLEHLDRTRSELESVGLVQPDEPSPAMDAKLTPSEVAVIRTYAESALEKYGVLSPILRQVTSLTRFLNARYSGKRLRIDREQGFVVVLDDGSQLDPAELSSGEQQMLVLAYHIIFLAPPNTLVLIDEPELSLHVSWQSTLVDDLVEMGSTNSLSFLLATHSPTLIGARRGLRQSLDNAA
jgi:ABC-type transport system involved in cytochrome c biogenesis ATPase subunit